MKISTNIVSMGTNHLSLISNKLILYPCKLFIKSNNLKSELNFSINENIINFHINIVSDSILILREKNEIFTFPLIVKKEVISNKPLEIIPILLYKNGILTLDLKIKNIKNPQNINITGDLNKSIIVSKYNESINFNFLIIDYKIINFKINNKSYSQFVIDYDKYPSNLYKTNTGVKFNRACKYDITIRVDNQDFFIPKGTLEFTYIWNGNKDFYVLFMNNEIFAKKINRDNFIIELVIIPNPLRIKTNIPSLQNIDVIFKESNKKFTLKPGETEMEIDLQLNPGIRNVTISKVINAKPIKNNYTFFIK